MMKSTANTKSIDESTKQQKENKQVANLRQQQQKHNVSKRVQCMLNNEQILGKLVRILKCYNEYPSRYRLFIWKLLLKVPENYESYAAFVERGIHPAYQNLAKKYPLKSQKCVRVLERTLSALAHWSPIFAECDYLPLLVFPFVKLFLNNQVVCFEVVATLINNWCQHWFEFFPNPPMNILNMIENLLACHDRILLDHFVRYRITCQIYGWALLETIFSEVFSKNEWLILFDNIFSNHPGFLLHLVAAYSICNRTALMQIKDVDDVKFFYRHRNPVSVHHLLNEAFKMQKCTPSDINPCKLLRPFEPLTKGTYPVFNKQPRFISDYQIIEKTKILKEEIDYLKERENHLEYHKYIEGKKLETEYLLKQMLWDKAQSQTNARMYQQSVDDYERRQKNIEHMRLKTTQQTTVEKTAKSMLPNVSQLGLKVGGEPVMNTDKHGYTVFNKMQMIDENFDEIKSLLAKKREISQKAEAAFDGEADEHEELFDMPINSEEDLKEIEKELISSRAEALLGNLVGGETTKKSSQLRDEISNVSSQLSLDRGRDAIEQQETETIKRIYQMRQRLASERKRQINS